MCVLSNNYHLSSFESLKFSEVSKFSFESSNLVNTLYFQHRESKAIIKFMETVPVIMHKKLMKIGKCTFQFGVPKLHRLCKGQLPEIHYPLMSWKLYNKSIDIHQLKYKCWSHFHCDWYLHVHAPICPSI